MSLKDKVVLITGAGSGMGRAMVNEFLLEGARVAAVDINADNLRKVVEEADAGDRAIAVATDVADEASVEVCVADVLAWSGQIDVLCNNAGIIDSFRPAHEISIEEWNRTLAVNLTGPFLMARSVIRNSMLPRSTGAIVNTASISSLSAGGGGTAYTASKHGVLGLTRQLTFDYGRHGIRVNAICPGATYTNLAAPESGSDTLPDSETEIARTPARRWGQPREIARFAVYLAGDDAAFIHGSAMVIDGGWLTAARNPI
ncbi:MULTISPECIES: SDR family NAD(P)-dependent oxidoreductase [Streptomyces]|uniref:SDR family NAD(P)-dependent oxidoreductase n=1 Tax=Streptomyces lycopersici TaxID=2974589 RepID=UPI0021D1FD2B|nr:glucose 1-dehydrogenase [Streptomyces sp. NEAU-383]